MEVRLKVYTYSRVATPEDDRIAFQEKNLDSFCSKKGFEVLAAFTDVSPDHQLERPGLSAMFEVLSEVEAVVVTSIDRITRSPEHFEQIKAQFRKHDVKLLAIL